MSQTPCNNMEKSMIVRHLATANKWNATRREKETTVANPQKKLRERKKAKKVFSNNFVSVCGDFLFS